MSRSRPSLAPRPRRWTPALFVWLGIVLLALALLAGLLFAPKTLEPRGPAVGDHWHASLSINICGELQPPLPASPGDVHSHGDGLIHIHPANASEAGSKANLELFFASTGTVISKEWLQLPGGALHRTGDPCPGGGAASLRVFVNGEAAPDFLKVVPKDGDVIMVDFR